MNYPYHLLTRKSFFSFPVNKCQVFEFSESINVGGGVLYKTGGGGNLIIDLNPVKPRPENPKSFLAKQHHGIL
jgi:hypothetical protein